MPKQNLTRIERAERNHAITQDYIKGLNYCQLSKKYDLSKGLFTRILNTVESKKLQEEAFSARLETLPLVIAMELQMLMDPETKAETKLKIMHKIMDDTGIGTSHTPHSIALNIFNQSNLVFSPFARKIVDNLTGKAVGRVDPELLEHVVEAEYTEENNKKDG